MQILRFSVVIEKDADGYVAFVPDLPGCYTQGDTYEEVVLQIRDAIRLHIEDRMSRDEQIPEPELVSFTTVEIPV